MLRSRPLLSFCLLAYGYTAAVMLPLALTNHGIVALPLPPEWEALAAFGPFIAAWLVLRAAPDPEALPRFWRSLRHWRLDGMSWLIVVGSPLAFLVCGIGAMCLAGSPPELSMPRLDAHGLRVLIDLVVVGALLQSLGEEPGWRGFLLPRLRQRHGALVATLVLYPVWLFWHLPMVLARPDFSLAQFGGFALGILSAAIWLTLIYERTKSTFAAVVWHTLINLTRGIALALSTATFLAYGMAVTVSAVLVALYLARRSELG